MAIKDKASKAKTEQRITTLLNLLLDGTRSKDIVRNMSEKWGVSTRQIERYIQKATELIKDQHEEDREYNISLQYHRLLYIYRISLEKEAKF